ncbi:hypothetical protein [Methylobacterium sp. ID0610]|uniref:hypothetical protein n=1 Tax=Methylobacterium carpenticola TaxID=3344827 RepID=UPI00368A57C1
MIHVDPAAVAAHRHDPIFAAIERHRLAHYGFGEAITASDPAAIRARGGATSPSALAILDGKRDEADAADERAWREIFTVQVTTFGGLVALLHHLDTYLRSYEGMDDEPEVFAALAVVVQGLALPDGSATPQGGAA